LHLSSSSRPCVRLSVSSELALANAVDKGLATWFSSAEPLRQTVDELVVVPTDLPLLLSVHVHKLRMIEPGHEPESSNRKLVLQRQ